MYIDSEQNWRLESGDRLRIIFKGDPVTKKNSQRILRNHKTGAPFIVPSAKYKAYEAKCLYEIHKQICMFKKHGKPLRQPINVAVHYHTLTRRRVDLVNLLESTLDILTTGGIIADDCADIVASMDGSRVIHDPESPRAEILITPAADVSTTWADVPPRYLQV